MSESEDIQDAIEQSAKGPKRASGDTGSIEQHSLPDQIAADQYLASKAAVKNRVFPLKRFKMIPPGAD